MAMAQDHADFLGRRLAFPGWPGTASVPTLSRFCAKAREALFV